jgi:hypothetical protein
MPGEAFNESENSHGEKGRAWASLNLIRTPYFPVVMQRLIRWKRLRGSEFSDLPVFERAGMVHRFSEGASVQPSLGWVYDEAADRIALVPLEHRAVQDVTAALDWVPRGAYTLQLVDEPVWSVHGANGSPAQAVLGHVRDEAERPSMHPTKIRGSGYEHDFLMDLARSGGHIWSARLAGYDGQWGPSIVFSRTPPPDEIRAASMQEEYPVELTHTESAEIARYRLAREVRRAPSFGTVNVSVPMNAPWEQGATQWYTGRGTARERRMAVTAGAIWELPDLLAGAQEVAVVRYPRNMRGWPNGTGCREIIVLEGLASVVGDYDAHRHVADVVASGRAHLYPTQVRGRPGFAISDAPPGPAVSDAYVKIEPLSARLIL